ncbi:MAG: DUF6582 domain-containing protein [Solirubrobacteraceae bacterium]
MATERQKRAARRNITATQGSGHRAAPRRGNQLRERDRNQLDSETFAFPAERKEPLNDAAHVRNAVARFDQVEGVSDAERDRAWRRIRAAARKHGVVIEAPGWRSLMTGGRTGR